MAKTKREPEEDHSIAIAKAESQYDSVVKPAQEKYKVVEHVARIILEESTNPLWILMPAEIHPNVSSQVRDGELMLKDELEKTIGIHEESYRKVMASAMSDYREIEKPAKRVRDATIKLANVQCDDAIKELRKVDDWFVFRRTYQKSLRLSSETEKEARQAGEEERWQPGQLQPGMNFQMWVWLTLLGFSVVTLVWAIFIIPPSHHPLRIAVIGMALFLLSAIKLYFVLDTPDRPSKDGKEAQAP